MPQPDQQSDEILKDHLRSLEQQQEDVRAAFERGEIDEAEYNRRSGKLTFQVASLQQRQEREEQRQDERSQDVRHERSRNIFGD